MWQYENTALNSEQLQINESLFTLANGYLGIRGSFEEGYNGRADSIRGTYINGLYDTLPVTHPERLYGFPEFQDKQPNLVDLQSMKVELDGEEASLFNGRHSKYERILYLDKGYTRRSYVYKTNSGKNATISYKRCVSFETKELFVQQLEIEFDGEIKVTSTLDANVSNYVNKDDPRVGSEHAKLLKINKLGIHNNSDKSSDKSDMMVAQFQTVHSKIGAACASVHKSVNQNGGPITGGYLKSEDLEDKCIYFVSTQGKITVSKYNVYTDQIRYEKPLEKAVEILSSVSERSFETHLKTQEQKMNAFWKTSDIEIQGEADDQLAIRYNLFQLNQSVGRDKFSNISAKGLSGEGYEGHYFWDTEIYVLPTFQLSQNDVSKNLLMYRYNQLDAARARAREMGHAKGVKFPWRTISGIECSAFFPAGTAQYHINGDIAHAFIQNFINTDDQDFMKNYGVEVLLETGLLWLDLGHFHKGAFKIDCVTGPDEYTAIVNNNYYTNALAKHNLHWVVKICKELEQTDAEWMKSLYSKLGITKADLESMRRASDLMYLPHDEALGIDMQDDGFLNKKMWDFENTPDSKYPLLLHYHPLTIYRYQVLKQPDTVLAHYLLEDYSTEETMRKSFNYYEAITTHDSSLSPCVYGIMASRVGYKEKAYNYFVESLKLDLENTHGNTKDGLHMANLAGTALSIITGFGGLRITDDGLVIRPWLPQAWEGYSFNIQYKQRQLKVHISDEIAIELISAEDQNETQNETPITLKVYNQDVTITDKVFLPLKG